MADSKLDANEAAFSVGNIGDMTIQEVSIEKKGSVISFMQIERDYAIKNVNLSNLTITGQDTQARPALFQFNGRTESIRLANVFTSSWKAVKQDGGVFAFRNGKSFLAENITIKTTERNVPFENAYDISNFNEVDFRQVSIQMIDQFYVHPVLTFKALGCLKIANVSLTLRIINNESESLFYIQNVQTTELNSVNLNSSILQKLSPFTIIYQGSGELTNFQANSFTVWNSSISKASLLSVEFSSSQPMFDVTNFEFRDSKFTESHTIMLYLDKEDVYNKGNLETSNFSISRCNFTSSKVLTAQYARDFIIQNLTCKDSNFSSRNSKEAYIFGIVAYRALQILDINFTNIQFSEYFIFSIDPYYTVGFFTRGSILNTNFTNSGIVTTSKSSLATSSDARSSYMYLQGVNFTGLGVKNTNSLGVLDLNGLFYFVTECKFENITLNAGTFVTLKEFLPDEWLNLARLIDLTPDPLKISQAILFSRIKSFLMKPAIAMQYRFDNNSVIGIVANDTYNLLTYSYTSSFIKIEYLGEGKFTNTIIRDNRFMRIVTKTFFITLTLADYASISDNSFSNVTGTGSFWLFEEFSNDQILYVQKNVLEDFQQVQFLKIKSEGLRVFTLSSNVVSSSYFGLLPFLDFGVTNNTKPAEVYSNLFLSTTVGQKGLMNFVVVNGKELYFANNSLEIQLIPKQQKAEIEERLPSIIYFFWENGRLTMEDCKISFEDESTPMAYYLLFSFDSVSIKNITVTISKVTPESLFGIVTEAITITNSAFFFNDESGREQMSLMKASSNLLSGYLSLSMSSIRLESANPKIKRNLVNLVDTKQVDFVFKDNEITDASLVFNFKNIQFSRFNIRNLKVFQQQSAEISQWMQFTKCSGNVTLEKISFLTPLTNISMNLIKVNDSPNISLILSELTIDCAKDKSDLREYRNFNSLQLIDIDSGTFILDHFRVDFAYIYGPMFLASASLSPVTLTLKQVKLIDLDHYLSGTMHYVGMLQAVSFGNYKFDLNIIESEFKYIDAASDILAVLLPPNSTINITKSQFISNTHYAEGSNLFVWKQDDQLGVSVSSRMVFLVDSNFSNNRARYYGGAISLKGAELVLTNTTFQNNSAPLGSSIFLGEDQSDFLRNCSTNLLKEIGLPPSRLRLKRLTQTNSWEYTSGLDILLEIHNVTSYELNSMEVIPEDLFNRTFTNFSLNITNVRTKEYITSSWGNISCLTPDLTGLVGGYSGNTETLAFAIQILGIDVQIFQVQVHFRNCTYGEIPSTKNLNQGCMLCPAGEYSLNPGLKECDPCPKGTTCPGGSRLKLQKGFWRNNTMTDRIIPCHANMSENSYSRCQGGYYSKCQGGYQGPLCHQCDFQNQYVRSGSETDFRCLKCPEAKIWGYLIAISLFCLFVAYEIYFIHTAIKTGRLYYEAALTDENHVVPAFGPYISLITTYFQILSIISMFNIDVINSILRLSSFLGEPSSKIYSSLDCILLGWEVNPDNLMMIRLILLVASPILKWVIVMLYYLVIKRLNRDRKIVIGVTGLSLFLLEQPQILKALFQYLNCVQLDSEDSSLFIYGYENFSCDSDQYRALKYWFVIPAVTCFCCIPLVLFCSLYKKKQQNKLNSEWTRCIMGVLYNGLNKEAYFWGIIGNISKIILIALTIIINNLNLLTPLLIIWFYSYKLLLSWKKPYLSRKLMMAENYMINAYLAALFCAYCMVKDKVDIISKVFFLILIVVANFYAIGFVVFVLVLMSKSKAQQGINWIKYSKLGRVLRRLFLGKGKKKREKVDDVSSSLNNSVLQSNVESNSDYSLMDEQPAGGDHVENHQGEQEKQQQTPEDRL